MDNVSQKKVNTLNIIIKGKTIFKESHLLLGSVSACGRREGLG